MSMNQAPASQRIHISFFGQRNAGKSSVVNAVTGQSLSVVSDIKGTTTDPVSKSMELLPLGAVVITDTPGFDDEGDLGALRVRKTKQVLNKTDLAVLVVDGTRGMTQHDEALLALFAEKKLPHLIVYNKRDLCAAPSPQTDVLWVSARTGEGIEALKERLGALQPSEPARKLIRDVLKPNDVVVMVTPIDASAPKGRIILPQQLVLREILDADAIAMVCKETQLAQTLAQLEQPPALVITDSQVFHMVAQLVPEQVPLTSFSILMARYHGFLETAVQGVRAIDTLQDGARVLMAEGCTHHRQCNDIGTVKIPNWLKQATGVSLHIETCSGTQFPDDLSPYDLIIHCGGCMLNQREMQYRMHCAIDQQVPFTNYGTTIAHMQGILSRSLRFLPALD